MGEREQPEEGCIICRKHSGEISVPGVAIYQNEWPDAPHGGEVEIINLCNRLRSGLRVS